MFGIGFSEIVIIALVVIVFVRPADLPAFVGKLGRLYGQAKRAYNEILSVKDEFIREMDIVAALKESEKPAVKPDGNAGSEAVQPPSVPSPSAPETGIAEASVKTEE